MNEGIQEKINNLSMLEQNTQQLSAQRQQFQTQLLEIESAIDELKNSQDAYKIIGSIMIKTDSAKLQEELLSKKKILDIRISSIEKQEDAAKEKAKKFQEEIMNELENSKNSKKEIKEDEENDGEASSKAHLSKNHKHKKEDE
jgi:prefoldin beta subunit